MKNFILSILFIHLFTFFSTAQIINLPVSAVQDSICSGETTTIMTTGSQVGVDYYLRNSNNTIITGPIAGSGNDITFSTGALSNSETYNIIGEGIVSGLDFDGTNDRVVTTFARPNANNLLTVEAWIYPRANESSKVISTYHGVGGLPSGEFTFMTMSGNAIRFFVANAGQYGSCTSANNAITLNVWNHIAATFGNGVITLYVNGQFASTANASFATIPAAPNSHLSIGEDRFSSMSGNVNEYFNGVIDEVRVWDTERTANHLFTYKDSCLSPNQPNLMAYYTFEDAPSTTLVDLVAGKNGTLTSMDAATDWTVGADLDCSNFMTYQMTQTAPVTVTNVLTTLSLNGSTLMANQTGASYQWLDCDNGNSAIAGATNQSFTPTANGNYAVEITLNNCVETTNCTNVTGVGISRIPTIDANIYPNPTNGVLNIVTKEVIEEAKIYTINGVLVKTISNNLSVIQVSELAQGMYILELTSEKGLTHKRFTKA